MKALVLNTSLKKAIVEDVDRPNPGSHEILINVRAIALNPVDELYVSSPIAAQGKRIIGTDFAGVVVEAGSAIDDLSDPRVKAGTRVAGFLQGGMYFVSGYLTETNCYSVLCKRSPWGLCGIHSRPL